MTTSDHGDTVRWGLLAEPWTGDFDQIVDEVDFAAAAGLDIYWMAQVPRFDAITAVPLLAARAPQLKFGTAVVAIYHRHPVALASQALTASLLTGGRFTLGIGLLHRPVIEGMFEMSFDRPVRHMREYLDILGPSLEQQPVDVSGQTVSFHGRLDVPHAPPCPLMIAALGDQMLRLCGRRASGTITFMTGPRTIREHVVPVLSAAADQAGRPAPRVVALVPVTVTSDIDRARARAAKLLAGYGQMPSYRAMLDREGLRNPEDFALIGHEDEVRSGLDAFVQAGATDIGLYVMTTAHDRDRTRALIATLPSR